MHLTGVHYHGGETFFLNTHSFVLTMKILVQSVKAPLKKNPAVQCTVCFVCYGYMYSMDAPELG